MRRSATLTFLLALGVTAALADEHRAISGKRAAVFRASGFPTADAPAITDATLQAAFRGLPVATLDSVEAVAEKLDRDRFDLLILPYGSAFPLDPWEAIRDFVEDGGSLVVLGGAPFHQPVRRVDDSWTLGVRQPTFAHELLIGPAEVWTRSTVDESVVGLRTAPVADSGWTLELPEVETVYELTVRLGTRADMPHEHGSEGHRDAVLRPLVHVSDAQGVPRACPLLEIDRLRGTEAGGRWIFAPTETALSVEVIRALVVRALEGAAQLEARPVLASLERGEIPAIRIAQRRPGPRAARDVPASARVVVRDPAGQVIHDSETALTGQPASRHGLVMIRTEAPLGPGLYDVEVSTPEASYSPRIAHAGFWVRDEELLRSAPPLTVSRDWLRSDGRVLPVVGSTYMASDVQRKFLFEADAGVFDRDFAQMRQQGINFVRTGLWTAWSRAMLNAGAVAEDFLRGLDAYVASAARHGIVVNFTFFAFQPPSYGGTHPFLDPRALDGQRELLTLVARRFRGIHWVHWDLINEPSYAPSDALWTNQPVRDLIEEEAWIDWVVDRHGSDEALLRDRWQDPAENVFELPTVAELYYTPIRDRRRPRKVRDFNLFSQEVVTGWARTLRDILREAGGEALVTLGQDEGGTYTRPSQQLHAEAVDYTAVHPWWQNDEILATGVFAKVPEKPNLFQETGLMRLEDLDGWPWRDPETAARTLERKYAYAFASRGAGVIEWAWNINPYQPIDNESVIGFFRPDGTAKRELRVVSDFADFFAKASPYLDDYDADPVIAIIPHSRLLMARPRGADGFKRIVRVMAERFGVVPLGLSELRLTPARLAAARLIIVPSPLVLEDDAAEALAAAAAAGSKLLVLGSVVGNPYGVPGSAASSLGIVDPGRPVELREPTNWGDESPAWATFEGGAREQLRRSNGPPLSSLEGGIWHEPLPLELASEEGPLVALLAAALEAAGVETYPSEDRVAARLLKGPLAILAVVVNESAIDANRKLRVEGRAVEIPVEAGRSRLVLFERGSGRVIVANRGPQPRFVD